MSSTLFSPLSPPCAVSHSYFSSKLFFILLCSLQSAVPPSLPASFTVIIMLQDIVLYRTHKPLVLSKLLNCRGECMQTHTHTHWSLQTNLTCIYLARASPCATMRVRASAVNIYTALRPHAFVCEVALADPTVRWDEARWCLAVGCLRGDRADDVVYEVYWSDMHHSQSPQSHLAVCLSSSPAAFNLWPYPCP